MPINALVKSQDISSQTLLNHITSTFNDNNSKFLKIGKFKIPLSHFMQYSTINIDYADLEFGINIHEIKDTEIFGTYEIKDNDSSISFKIRVKREMLDPKKKLQEKIDVLKEEKNPKYIA